MKPHCQACTNEKYNLQLKNPVAHVCEKGVKQKPVEIKKFRDGTEFVKILVRSKLFYTGKATKYLLKKQVINGCKVKSGTEIWFSNQHIVEEELGLVEKRIWIYKEQYDKLIFVD